MQSTSRMGHSRMNSVRTLNTSLPSITQSKAALFGQSSPLRLSEAETYGLEELLKRNQVAEHIYST